METKKPKDIWNMKMKKCWPMNEYCAFADDELYCHFFRSEQIRNCNEEKKKLKDKKVKIESEKLF